jgi:hypothetical protein
VGSIQGYLGRNGIHKSYAVAMNEFDCGASVNAIPSSVAIPSSRLSLIITTLPILMIGSWTPTIMHILCDIQLIHQKLM